ncbi:MAG: PhoPQ-activated pathogenicity-related family protein [Opitutaceae bacterium]
MRTPAPSRLIRWFIPSTALAILVLAAGHLPAAGTQRTGATTTALDRYVAAPDPNFSWKRAGGLEAEGVSADVLDVISQHWTPPGGSQPVPWQHWVTIIRPPLIEHSAVLLFISGGSNRPRPAPKPSRELVEIAKATRSIVAEVRNIPNQPLTLESDGKERKEDDFIARTWLRFLETGDERWPARLPMTKAAVRAMDAVTAFLATPEGGGRPVEKFVVAGASKRGWTTWTTAIVDSRVVAICPLVIDILNVEASMDHHHRAYGFFAPAVGDYFRQGIMGWSGTPEARALYTIEDPFSYRDRLALPKLLINACGDQFFLPDSSQFYFADLPGPKYLRYIPNTDHSLKNSDAPNTIAAWHHAVLTGARLPQLSWRQDNGALVVSTGDRPRQARLWRATNPAARDFRLETFGAKWTSEPLNASGDEIRANVPEPAAGWTAYLVELEYDLGGPAPLKLTTEVTVTPRKLPFGAFPSPRPKGFLSQ